MLAVWLIENDATDQRSSSSRLPLAVIVAHMTLAVSGLVVWVAYLLLDRQALAWTALCILGGIALLGFTMVARWIPVYQAAGVVAEPVPVSSGGVAAEPAQSLQVARGKPPEGNFPLFIVVAHGAFGFRLVRCWYKAFLLIAEKTSV